VSILDHRALHLTSSLFPRLVLLQPQRFRIPWATLFACAILALISLVHFWVGRSFAPVAMGVVVLFFASIAVFYVQVRRLGLLATPATLALLPRVRADIVCALVFNCLWFSLLLAAVLNGLLSDFNLLAMLVMLMFGVIMDVRPGRLRSLVWLLVMLVSISILVMQFGFMPFYRGNAERLEVALGLLMVIATAFAMIGLIQVRPFVAIAVSGIWIWLIRFPTALPGFDFNVVLKLSYATFTQLGTHFLTALIAIRILVHCLFKPAKSDGSAEAVPARKADIFDPGGIDFAWMAPSSWLHKPYRWALAKAVRHGRLGAGTTTSLARYQLTLGPSLHWPTLVTVIFACCLVASAFLLAARSEMNHWLGINQLMIFVLILYVIVVDMFVQHYTKRQPELAVMAMTPFWPAGRAFRLMKARHAAVFVLTSTVLLIFALWLVRVILEDIPLPLGERSEDSLLHLFLQMAVMAAGALAILIYGCGPERVSKRSWKPDAGFLARAALILLAMFPLHFISWQRQNPELRLMLLSLLLVAWMVIALWEYRKLATEPGLRTSG